MTDYLNAIQMIPLGGTLLADDTTDRFKGAKSSFHRLVELGYLRQGSVLEVLVARPSPGNR